MNRRMKRRERGGREPRMTDKTATKGNTQPSARTRPSRMRCTDVSLHFTLTALACFGTDDG